jgi:Tfp pilus assembly major pilin PilA
VDHHDFAAAINIIHRKVTANNHNEIDSLRLNNTSTGMEKTNKRPFFARHRTLRQRVPPPSLHQSH